MVALNPDYQGVPEPPRVILDPDEPPEVRAARLRIYEQRAEARLPLFEEGPAAPPEPGRGHANPECFGCGIVAPTINHLDKHGWHVIPSGDRYYKFDIYCPDCFPEVR